MSDRTLERDSKTVGADVRRRKGVRFPPETRFLTSAATERGQFSNTLIERSSARPDHARPNSAAVIEANARQESANPWPTFAIVAVGTFMIMLDGSIVNISLPSIARTFHTPVGGAMEWVIIAYLVTIAGTLLTFGRLSDMIGRKPIWLAGLALFTVGSGICGAANSLALLVAARAFQGLGGALLLSTSVAIITDP